MLSPGIFSALSNSLLIRKALTEKLVQSVVLATRPVLVHILFEKISVSSTGRVVTEPIKALIKACFESAEKSLRILTALRSQDLLGMTSHPQCKRAF